MKKLFIMILISIAIIPTLNATLIATLLEKDFDDLINAAVANNKTVIVFERSTGYSNPSQAFQYNFCLEGICYSLGNPTKKKNFNNKVVVTPILGLQTPDNKTSIS